MRKYLLTVAALAMMLGFAPSALADKPSETGNKNRPCEQVPLHPLCDADGNFLPPGLGGPNPGCDNAPEGKNPNCPPDEEEPEAPADTCPPGGPVTNVAFQVTGGIRDNGGAALADPLDQILCAVYDLTGL